MSLRSIPSTRGSATRLAVAFSTAALIMAAVTSSTVAAGPSTVAYLKASEIASGYTHSCAIGAQGYLYCWGQNTYGQLGDGSTTDSSVAVAVLPPAGVRTFKGVTSLAIGDDHGCAVRSGAVLCWGSNVFGQLGQDVGSVDHSAIPMQVPNEIGAPLGGIVAVAGASLHTCALASGGTVWCWGRGTAGQLGNGSTPDTSGPVRVVGALGNGFLTGVTQIAAGGEDTCALKGDGTVWCWGLGMYGALGDGQTSDSAVPVQVDATGWAGTKVSRIDVGDYASCATTAVGTAWCWGYGGEGELGNGLRDNSAVPVEVSSGTGFGFLTGVSRVTVGYDHTCAATTSGSTWCWGANEFSQLGLGMTSAPDTCGYGTIECSLVPQQVVGPGAIGLLAGVSRISTGYYHTCAVTSRGAVYCWGPNGHGQLGDGTTTDSGSPVRVRL